MKKAKDLAHFTLLSTGMLAVKVTPGARQEGVEGINEANQLVVKVRAQASDGKANEAVIGLISREFGLAKSRLTIVRGFTSRHKVVAYQAG